MKDTITKSLENISKTITGFFKDLDTISKDIIDIKTTRADLESNGNYTKTYIDELIEKETQSKSGHIATTIDTLRAGVEDLKEYTHEINDATDVYDDARLTAAIATVQGLKEGTSQSKEVCKLLINQFKGNFPAIQILGALAPETEKGLFSKMTVTNDDLELMTDDIGGAIITLESMNISGDLTGLSTRIYDLEKDLSRIATQYGVKINRDDYKSLSLLFEAKQNDDMRAALGLK